MELSQKNEHLREEVWMAHDEVQNEMIDVWQENNSEWEEADKTWSLTTKKISENCDPVMQIKARIEDGGQARETMSSKEDDEVDNEDEEYEFV